ncbi:MAG: aa3-type cytochrome c oxidase subunit IV, partial [Mesorhizobium sp.]
AAILLAMAFGFFAGGFFSATILFIVIMAVGYFILR